MPTTRPEQDQATQPVQSDQYQPAGRQEPTNPDALYGGNADDNSGSGGNLPAKGTPPKTAPTAETDADGNAQTDEEGNGQNGPNGVGGPSASAGTGASGGSIGQVTL